MKRVYDVKLEKGARMYAREYTVIASTDEEAVRKAKRTARADSGIKTGWRCVELRERETELVA